MLEKIVDELKAQDFDNTVVVFLSDNGGPTPNNASLNAPLRGGKGIYWKVAFACHLP